MTALRFWRNGFLKRLWSCSQEDGASALGFENTALPLQLLYRFVNLHHTGSILSPR